jgi:hypothetical protein
VANIFQTHQRPVIAASPAASLEADQLTKIPLNNDKGEVAEIPVALLALYLFQASLSQTTLAYPGSIPALFGLYSGSIPPYSGLFRPIQEERPGWS